MDSERIAMIIDEKEYWHPSDDEVINHSESSIPFEITMDTLTQEDVVVTGTFSTNEEGEFYDFETYKCDTYLEADDVEALMNWITDKYLR